MTRPRRLKYKELCKKLRKYGIIVNKTGGKGSHRKFIDKKTKKSYPFKCHNENQEYSKNFVRSIARKFSIPEEELFD
ncbi:MAG: type II toxin-antitoxin system HicA family toxin [bacterium]